MSALQGPLQGGGLNSDGELHASLQNSMQFSVHLLESSFFLSL
jgi:hypothetical protein